MSILQSNNNFSVGPGAGESVTTGTGNLLIGPNAGCHLTTESNWLVVTDWKMAEPYLVYICLHLLKHGDQKAVAWMVYDGSLVYFDNRPTALSAASANLRDGERAESEDENDE